MKDEHLFLAAYWRERSICAREYILSCMVLSGLAFANRAPDSTQKAILPVVCATGQSTVLELGVGDRGRSCLVAF